MTAMPDINALLSGPLGAWLDEQALVRERAHKLAVNRWWKAARLLDLAIGEQVGWA